MVKQMSKESIADFTHLGWRIKLGSCCSEQAYESMHSVMAANHSWLLTHVKEDPKPQAQLTHLLRELLHV
jgi:hypothetical protein